MLKANVPKLDPREEHFWVAGPRAGMQLFLRRLSPAQPAPKDRIVLYAHGGTFPSALSIAHRFDGESWRDVLCAAGFDVWAFDCYAFGASDRYPEMNEPATKNPSLCRAPEAAEQLAAVVRFILEQQAVPRLSIIPHSWGSIPAGRFSGAHRPSSAVRSGGAPDAAALRKAAKRAGLADRDARGAMGALYGGCPCAGAAGAFARAFRRLGRALPRQRSGQPPVRSGRRKDS